MNQRGRRSGVGFNSIVRMSCREDDGDFNMGLLFFSGTRACHFVLLLFPHLHFVSISTAIRTQDASSGGLPCSFGLIN